MIYLFIDGISKFDSIGESKTSMETKMNRSKKNDPRHWLRVQASGGVQQPGERPDHKGFMTLEAKHELAGDPIVAGIMRVEADNDRSGWKKAHKPNLGPYSATNPGICQDCGKSQEHWTSGEECVPNQ
jgi:hypothetical protein